MISLNRKIDQRALPVRHLNMTYEVPRYRTLQEWQARARELREHIVSVCGLRPMPEAPPLNAHIFGAIEYADYVMSKVYFQSYAGLLVTGNLFEPRGKKGPFPAVLNPHGHWPRGRFTQTEDANIAARGITFARQGYVALCYDMIGYGDSYQFTHQPDSDRQALWAAGLLPLQLYNSIRAIDFLQSLPTVDPERIGCTGESGGGTQTFMLTAVDDRIKVSVPVNMISAHMQGGCYCENTPGLRIETSNPEIAALMAPRPMLIISATGDWTCNTPTVEYPCVRDIYQLYGATERVKSVQVDADHNYNQASRNAAYRFFGKWLLGCDDEGALLERSFRREPKKQYQVFAEKERPASAPVGEKLLDKIIRQRQAYITKQWPQTKKEATAFHQQCGAILRHLMMTTIPERNDITMIPYASKRTNGVMVKDMALTRTSVGDHVPAVFLSPAQNKTRSAVLVVSDGGREECVQGETGTWSPFMHGLLEQGHSILMVDCWGTGAAKLPPEREKNAKEVVYFTTYNKSDDVHRIQDILTGLAYLRSLRAIDDIRLLGLGRAGVWTLLARTQAPFVQQTIVDMACFQGNKDADYGERLFIPGIRNIGGITTAAALVAPGKLVLHNTGPKFDGDAIAHVYALANKRKSLTISKKQLTEEEIIKIV